MEGEGWPSQQVVGIRFVGLGDRWLLGNSFFNFNF